MIEFQSDIQQEYYDKLENWVRELYRKEPDRHDALPMFHLWYQSTLVHIAVWPWGKDKAALDITCTVVSGARICIELMRYLLEQNADLPVGAFYLDDRANVCFRYTLIGNTWGQTEMKEALTAVLVQCDDQDDKIMERWGGRRAVDLKKKSPDQD